MREPIVVAADFSARTEIAMQHAVCIARRVGAGILLVHVGEVPDVAVGMPETLASAATEYRRVLEYRLAAARERLRALAERYRESGVSVTPFVKQGFPSAAICSAAVEFNARIVIVGTHGYTGVKWLWLGSVARRIVRLAPCPVLVARDPVPEDDGYHKILVGVDFSRGSRVALAETRGVAAGGATVELVHGSELRTPFVFSTIQGAGLVGELEESLVANVEQEGARWVRDASTEGLRASFRQLNAKPRDAIIHVAEAGGYDLVVVGSHGRRGFQRMMLGSVAEAVAISAPCSVLVAHSSDARPDVQPTLQEVTV